MTAVAFSPNGMALDRTPLFAQAGIDQLLGKGMPFQTISSQVNHLPTAEGIQKALSIFTMGMDSMQLIGGAAKGKLGEAAFAAVSLSEEVMEKLMSLRKSQDRDMDPDPGQDLSPSMGFSPRM